MRLKRKTTTEHVQPLPFLHVAPGPGWGGGHNPQLCIDPACDRLACMAYKAGYSNGYRDGYTAGYAAGYAAGQAAAS